MSISRSEKVGLSSVAIASVGLLALLTADEGTRYTPYRDIGGVWTVCQGHTGPDVIPGTTYTKKDCDELLVKNATKYGMAVLRCTTVPLNQNQYDAFTRFTFNVGERAFCKSTLLKKLNASDYDGACRELLRWVYVGGKRVPGLVNRRRSEYELCIKPPAQETRTVQLGHYGIL